ncbi:hypothetical protein F5Y18DRAFT_149996 [Xylariaceae sp. FL1019]|nr:hypothetical protein F5Y18DRAFT_149996 [Xylariaceae sp. FL1019]
MDDAPLGMTPAATRMASRRPHIKSRSGCRNCKKRKVKCGEERPSCRNCSKRGLSCDLLDCSSAADGLAHRPAVPTPAHTPSTSNAAQPSSRAQSSDGGGAGTRTLTMLDLELLHHYCASTCLTLSSDPVTRNYFHDNLPQVGFSHPYVLYSILALAASHLAHFRPESRQYYLDEATARHTAATSMAAPLLTDNSTTHIVPMYCFSTLTLFISFASLRVHEDTFFDADNAIPAWLNLFRGVRAVLELNSLFTSSISFLFRSRPEVNETWDTVSLTHDALKELQAHINESKSENDRERTCLLDVYTNLEKAYYFFYGEGCRFNNEAKLRSIFTWMYKVSNEYIDMLRCRNSNALCILAFFSVLLHQMDYNWWLNGWGLHLIDRIYSALDDGHRFYIRWPIQEIGWIPRRETY